MSLKNGQRVWWSIIVLIFFLSGQNLKGQMIYVDSVNGSDSNSGTVEEPIKTIGYAAVLVNRLSGKGSVTIRIGPGIYPLAEPVVFENGRQFSEKERLIIEAEVLPDDSKWKQSLMPVIFSIKVRSKPKKSDEIIHLAGLKIEKSFVTIRGVKFLGSPVHEIWYYPVFREGKHLKDLVVSQCMFLMEPYAFTANVGVLSNGQKTVIDHCVFYNCRNPVVFWRAEKGKKSKNNAMSYCIVDGAYTSGVWVCDTDDDFKFHHNIISRSEYVWMRDKGNKIKYHLNDCILVNNKYYSGECDDNGIVTKSDSGIVFQEKNVTKSGKILLEKGEGIDLKVPENFLHVVPGTLGANMGAGLFKNKVKSRSKIK